MRLHLTKILILCGFALLCLSCTKELEYTRASSSNDGRAWVDFSFSTQDELVLSTKAHQSYENENMVHDVFVFVFDASGSKVYDRYFSIQDIEDQSVFNHVSNENNECWYVSNSVAKGVRTQGAVRVNCPIGENLKIYIVTNMDSDRVYASASLLSRNINSLTDLQNFRLKLNVDSVERSNRFLTVGHIDNVTITEDNITGADSPIQLERCDAKVRFTFRKGTRPDDKGQTVKSFVPEKWKIVNIPRNAYLLERSTDYSNPGTALSPSEYEQYAPDFFDTEWKPFNEFESNNTASFGFYMLENRLEPKANATEYQQRSKQTKLASGLNSVTEVDYSEPDGTQAHKTFRNFAYANDFSTYILVRGHIEMSLLNDDAGQVLGANVEYLIHLGGQWTSSIADAAGSHWDDDTYSNVGSFDTERNHSYNYVVTINSVNNIRVEVETSDGVQEYKENQPGAWGDVTIAKEEIAVCDAHYSSKTLSFHASNFLNPITFDTTADNLTWSVSTPFSDVTYEEGVTPLSIIDYEWVKFRLNKKDEAGNYFENKRRKYSTRKFAHSTIWRDRSQNMEDDNTYGLPGYHNDGCMDIVALVAYMKQQAELFSRYKKGIDAENMSDFDNDDDPKISVTVFVDEYYYEENPLSKAKSPVLWKRFVNMDDRYLHILCDSRTSFDHESRATGSVVTIQQKAIQSIYNIYEGDDLVRAWGLEHEDEHPDIWLWSPTASNGNTEPENGYLNTMRLWNLANANNTDFITGVKWSQYMDIEVENDTPQLNDANRSLRYSCMTRNRDNNGNGVIDKDEIRWYTAAINQLVNLYMGENCISMSSRLYNREPDIQRNPGASSEQWMQHVCSSTRHSATNSPTIVWAEEGISTGGYSQNQWGASNKMTVRCVRNMGMDDADSMTETVTSLVETSERTGSDGKKYIVYDMSNIMPASKRDYSSEELPFHFETDPTGLLYEKFEAYHSQTTTGSSFNTFKKYNEELNRRIRSNETLFCPEGYRTPNQREMAVMHYFGGVNETLCRTAWSRGFYQTDSQIKRDNSKHGFVLSGGNIALYDPGKGQVRCVRDVRE